MERLRGPWRYSKAETVQGNPSWRIDSADQGLIASLNYGTIKQRDEEEGNAALIAAAPDLLAALEAMIAQSETPYPHFEFGAGKEIRDRAIEAVKKARGE